jgi:excisionase family DNA binding protein
MKGSTTIPFRDRLGCTVREACEATGLGRTKIYELIGDRRIKYQKVDGRTILNVPSLILLIDGGA